MHHAINFFWPVNIFIGRGSLGYEKLLQGYLRGTKIGKHSFLVIKSLLIYICYKHSCGTGNETRAMTCLLVTQMKCDTMWWCYLQHWSNHTYHQDNSTVVQHDPSAYPSDHGNHMSSLRSSRSTALVLAHHNLQMKIYNSTLVPHLLYFKMHPDFSRKICRQKACYTLNYKI